MELNREQRKYSQRCATLSSCFGAVPSVMLGDSALIILYASMLGGGEAFSMVTTAFSGLSLMLLLIPGAGVINHFGAKNTLMTVTGIGVALFLLVAAAPFFGDWAQVVLLTAIIIYTLSCTLYTGSWFPLLDRILIPEERGRYFSVMRFSWQMVSALYIFGSGLLLGPHPPLWKMQLLLAGAGILMLGRIWFVNKIPIPNREPGGTLSHGFRESFSIALNNKPLAGFAVYLFLLYLAAYATVPLCFVYLRKALEVPGNIVVIISALAMAGTIGGYLLAGRLIEFMGAKRLLIAIHFLFAGVNIILFLTDKPGIGTWIFITALLIIYGFFMSCSSVIVSTEMMSLAMPGNKTMAMAFCGTFYYGGWGLSRLLSSLVVASGILAPHWSWGSRVFSHYQTMFLFYGIMIIFVCLVFVVVPIVFPENTQAYKHH